MTFGPDDFQELMEEKEKFQTAETSNRYMKEAKELAEKQNSEEITTTATVIVKDGEILAEATNNTEYHRKHGCDRQELRDKGELDTGEGYHLCPGCNHKNHSERIAIRKAQENGENLEGAELCLYGHHWICQPCLDKIKEAGIKKIYLPENAEEKFKD